MQGNDSLGTFVPMLTVAGDVGGTCFHGYKNGDANSGSLVCEMIGACVV